MSHTTPVGTAKAASVSTHACGAGEYVNTTQVTAHGSASARVIREAHDIVRGNLNCGMDAGAGFS